MKKSDTNKLVFREILVRISKLKLIHSSTKELVEDAQKKGISLESKEFIDGLNKLRARASDLVAKEVEIQKILEKAEEIVANMLKEKIVKKAEDAWSYIIDSTLYEYVNPQEPQSIKRDIRTTDKKIE